MDFPSSNARHALRVDDHDTTKFLAHARQQADQRQFSDFPIVDVDSHIDESLSFSSIIGMMDSDVMRHFARSATRGALAHNLEYEDAAGRMPRFASAKLEKTSDNVLREVAVTNRRMDAMGVDVSCVLPTALLRLSVQPRRDIELEVAGGYNRWLVETFLPHAPRLRGMLYLPLCDADACFRTIADFGGEGGVVGAVVAAESYASIHRNQFMRTYRAMEERGLVLGFHSGVNWYDRGLGQSNRYLAVKSVGGPHFNAVHLANWIVNGLPERFPKLKILWMESGISWLLPLMARLDAGYLARSYDAPLLKRRPSEYMREMFYCTQPLERFADRDLLAAMFRAINADAQLVWGSNYPSSDFDLPSAVYDLPFLTEDGKRRILGENAKRLFGLS